MNQAAKFTTGAISKHLLTQSLYMMIGIISVYAFNLVDTYFVGQLGAKQLAALTFTFPVVSFLAALTLGLGMGVTSVVAKAYGQGDPEKIKALATDALSLSVIIVSLIVSIGLGTIEPLFSLLGATQDVLGDIKLYMTIWYCGMPFLVIPMIGNGIIRASGNFFFPMAIMVIAGLSNIIFDYFLIFGNGGFPAMGIKGAAYATVISRGVTFFSSLFLLGVKKKALINPFRGRDVFVSWREIIEVALPSGLMNIINPSSLAIVTSLIATHGEYIVAGFGAAMRLESMIVVPMFALSSSLNPIIAQNWGQQNYQRVKDALKIAFRFSFLWGSLAFLVFYFLAPELMAYFSEKTKVITSGVEFLHISPIVLIIEGIVIYSAVYFIAVGKSKKSFMISLFRFGIFYLPLAWLGEKYFGYKGVYWARVISGYLSALQCWIWIRNHQKSFSKKQR